MCAVQHFARGNEKRHSKIMKFCFRFIDFILLASLERIFVESDHLPGIENSVVLCLKCLDVTFLLEICC